MTTYEPTRNNLKLTSRMANRCKYAFVDSVEHRADRILIGALIPVSFERDGASKTDNGFELRVCSFDRKYESWFMACMADLGWVLGDDGDQGEGYRRACQVLLGAVAA